MNIDLADMIIVSGLTISGLDPTGYTFPASDGSNRQVLATDGSGIVYWSGISDIMSGFSDYEIVSSAKTDFNVNGGFTVGSLDVYYNGLKLLNGDDYVEVDGTGFTLSSAATFNDVIEWEGHRTAPEYVTLGNPGNNRLVTSDGSSTTINGQSDLIFDGTGLGLGTTSPSPSGGENALHIHSDIYPEIKLTNTDTNTTSSDGTSILVDELKNLRIVNFEQSLTKLYNAKSNGSVLETLRLGPTQSLFNPAGDENLDFLVSGSGSSNLIFADSSTNRVGIGNNSPTTKLDVSGVITASGGDSTQWNISYSTLTGSSGNWNEAYELVGNKDNWNTAFFWVTGNSGNVVYTDQTYENPSWLTSVNANIISGEISQSNLPPYVDDVLEYTSTGNFPGSATTGIIYIAQDTNKIYRWSGSTYIEISSDTNTFVDGVSFNSVNGDLTLSRLGIASIAANLDGRYTTGNGTTNYLTKWTSSQNISSGIIYDDGTNIGIGTNSPTQKLDIRDGDILVGTKLLVGSGVYSASSPGAYFGLKHTSLTGASDYMIMSAGNHTYISAKEDSDVYIRGGGNKTDHQIMVSESGITLGKYRPAASSVVAEHDVELVHDNIGLIRIGDRVGTGLLIGDGVIPGATNTVGIKHTAMTGLDDAMIYSDGTNTTVTSKESGYVRIRGGGNAWQSQISVLSGNDGDDGIVLNENGADRNIRMEGKDVANTFFLQASTNSIGIGTSTPNYLLDVAGSGSFNSLNINDAFTLPTSDGTEGQSLVTDGAGAVVWSGIDTDTNNYITGAAFDAATEVLTINRLDLSDLTTSSFSGVYLKEISQDSSPQLGGNLDLDSNNIAGNGNIDITGSFRASSINVNDAFTLPTVDGAYNQVLVTSGDGTVHWKNQTGGVGGGGTSNLIRQSYTPTTSTSSFTVTNGYAVGSINVYKNGVKLFEDHNGQTYDYSATNGTQFILTTAAASGDLIEVVALNANAAPTANTALASVGVTSTQSQFNTTETITSSSLAVFLNGVKLVDSIDYSVINTSRFDLLSPAASGDTVDYIVYGATIASSNLQKTGDTMTGNLTVGADLIVTGYKETHTDNGNTGTARTIDITDSTIQTYTLNGNCVFTMPTPDAGRSFTVLLKTGAGSFTGTFTGVKFPGNVAPTITASGNRLDTLTFISDGTNWYGNAVQDYHL